MIETPKVVTTNAAHYAAIRQRIPVAEIRHVMGPTCNEINQALAAQSIPPTGPWFTHHYVRPIEFFDFEVCFPVARPVAPAGRVQPGAWPAMRLARTTFHGNYAGLPVAWGELERWIESQKLPRGEEFWEVYTINPNDSANPEEWRTELNWPLADNSTVLIAV